MFSPASGTRSRRRERAERPERAFRQRSGKRRPKGLSPLRGDSNVRNILRKSLQGTTTMRNLLPSFLFPQYMPKGLKAKGLKAPKAFRQRCALCPATQDARLPVGDARRPEGRAIYCFCPYFLNICPKGLLVIFKRCSCPFGASSQRGPFGPPLGRSALSLRRLRVPLAGENKVGRSETPSVLLRSPLGTDAKQAGRNILRQRRR